MDLGGAEVHAWVQLVAQGMTDQRDKLWPTKTNMNPVRAQPWGAGGLGIILELEGSSEGGNNSVERNRQNKELFSNKILQMDQSNITNKSFSHSV